MSYNDPFTDHDPSKDLSRTRHVYIGKDNPVKIAAEDPYGFWKIHWHSGTTPLPLQGAYTTYEYAKSALDNWLVNNENKPVETKEAVTEDEIQEAKVQQAAEKASKNPYKKKK